MFDIIIAITRSIHQLFKIGFVLGFMFSFGIVLLLIVAFFPYIYGSDNIIFEDAIQKPDGTEEPNELPLRSKLAEPDKHKKKSGDFFDQSDRKNFIGSRRYCRVYFVYPGDTMEDICRRFEVSRSDVMAIDITQRSSEDRAE